MGKGAQCPFLVSDTCSCIADRYKPPQTWAQDFLDHGIESQGRSTRSFAMFTSAAAGPMRVLCREGTVYSAKVQRLIIKILICAGLFKGNLFRGSTKLLRIEPLSSFLVECCLFNQPGHCFVCSFVCLLLFWLFCLLSGVCYM